jgi:hypothetical protein
MKTLTILIIMLIAVTPVSAISEGGSANPNVEEVNNSAEQSNQPVVTARETGNENSAEARCERIQSNLNKNTQRFIMAEQRMIAITDNIQQSSKNAVNRLNSLDVQTPDVDALIASIDEDIDQLKNQFKTLTQNTNQLQENICNLDTPNLRREITSLNSQLRDIRENYLQIRNTQARELRQEFIKLKSNE